MIIQNVLLSNESYTHDNWVYKNINVTFSRIYYIIDGTAFYEENGKKTLLKHGYIYLTPIRKTFTLYDDPSDKLLHTYAHITTFPQITAFTEIKVEKNTPLFDAVCLWRKYSQHNDKSLIMNILSLVLSCIENRCFQDDGVAKRTKDFIDGLTDFSFDMDMLSKRLGYSREHLTKRFLIAYGTTPKKYFQTIRMNTALEKIKAGSKINAVSEELKYSSPYSFSKAFKKHFGLSPEYYILTLTSKIE